MILREPAGRVLLPLLTNGGRRYQNGMSSSMSSKPVLDLGAGARGAGAGARGGGDAARRGACSRAASDSP